jgi:hypothetical protein
MLLLDRVLTTINKLAAVPAAVGVRHTRAAAAVRWFRLVVAVSIWVCEALLRASPSLAVLGLLIKQDPAAVHQTNSYYDLFLGWLWRFFYHCFHDWVVSVACAVQHLAAVSLGSAHTFSAYSSAISAVWVDLGLCLAPTYRFVGYLYQHHYENGCNCPPN